MSLSESYGLKPALRTGSFQLLVVLLIALAIGTAFRVPALGLRPFHGDEANQAMRAGILLEEGVYEYDPHEHHGPTLYYFALLPLWMTGTATIAEASEATFRALPVFFGLALLALLWTLRHGLGYGAIGMAALFTALSPALIFYSRYFIQETLFIFFALAAISAGFAWWRKPGPLYAALSGVCLGLSFATKETCVILFFAMGAGVLGALFLARFRDGTRICLQRHRRVSDAVVFLLAGLVVSVALYSSFFTHWQGVLDSVRAFTTYATERAEGQGSAGIHDKPWHYYLTLLGWTYRSAGQRYSEGLLLGLGAVGILAALLRRVNEENRNEVYFGRFIAIYSLVVTVAFTLIPYKTPWNLLPFYQPLVLCAGIGAATIFRGFRWLPIRAVLAIALAAGMAHLGWQAWRINFVYPAHEGNPYVYAHTSGTLTRTTDDIREIAALRPNPQQMPIYVIQPDADYWPLPWYLRDFDQVAYWPGVPAAPDAPVIIADPGVRVELMEKLRGDYFIQMRGLRPNVLRFVLVRRDLWDAFVAGRSAVAPAQ
jgi:uncharacterized protein (TIGR03663 family)